ncbi:hypothetical protein ACNKHN_13420 [Shigella flexneri]
MEAITGFRVTPAWFRIGGVATTRPRGWDCLRRQFLDWMPTSGVLRESGAAKHHLKGRSQGVAADGAKRHWSGTTLARACARPGLTSTCVRRVLYSGDEKFNLANPGWVVVFLTATPA